MNKVLGEIRLGHDLDRCNSRPTTLIESARELSHGDANFKVLVSLTTLTATCFTSGPNTLLLWGLNPTHNELRSQRDFEDFTGRLANDPKRALLMLAGSWGLVFTNTRLGSAIVAADRSAQRPPCFHASANRLVFGLNARDVSMAAMHGGLPLRPQAIFDYLRGHVIAAPDTIFADVIRVRPGEYVSVDPNGVSHSFYWEPSYESASSGPLSFSVARERFLALLEKAVRDQTVHGKTGAYLSGGTDSSTIAGMLGNVTKEPPNTYSIGFDAPGFDEMEYARIAARHFKTAHHEYYVTPDDLVAAIPKVAQAYDQPFGNSSALPAYYCAGLAACDGVDRMLGGDGGDELFGGNTRYAKQKLFGAYDLVPRTLDRTLVERLVVRPSFSARIPFASKTRSYVLQARVPMPARLHTYNLLARLGETEIFTEQFLEQVDINAAAGSESTWYARCTNDNLVNRMLHYDWKYTLADNDLPKVITTCDIVRLEVAFPMLDERLVEFANLLPASWKVRGLRLRHFFKSALASFLPKEIIDKKKHGFGLPFGWWLVRHDGLQRLAFDALDSLRQRGTVRPEFIDDLVGARLAEHPGYFGELVWTLMMLELWLQGHASKMSGLSHDVAVDANERYAR